MFTELIGSSRNHVVNVNPFSYGHFASGGNTIACRIQTMWKEKKNRLAQRKYWKNNKREMCMWFVWNEQITPSHRYRFLLFHKFSYLSYEFEQIYFQHWFQFKSIICRKYAFHFCPNCKGNFDWIGFIFNFFCGSSFRWERIRISTWGIAFLFAPVLLFSSPSFDFDNIRLDTNNSSIFF